MKSHELIIEGMSCRHCVISVSKELSKIPGLRVQNVEIGRALVEYDDTEVTQAHIAKAIEEAGHRLVST